MWYLLIVIAYPDYKCPSSTTRLRFFETEDEAKRALKMSKIKFIKDFDISDDSRISDLTIDSDDSLIEELFDQTSYYDTFYSDSYMDIAPFDFCIQLVGQEAYM
jgi:hypothetical protein